MTRELENTRGQLASAQRELAASVEATEAAEMRARAFEESLSSLKASVGARRGEGDARGEEDRLRERVAELEREFQLR